MNITSDQSEPHTWYWLHTKAAQHFYVAMATSQQHQILYKVQPEKKAKPYLNRQQAGGCCTCSSGGASIVAKASCAVEPVGVGTADRQNPWPAQR